MIALPLSVSATLRLRLLTLDDAPAQYALLEANRNFIGVWLPWARTATAAGQRAFLAACLQRYAEGRGFACGIWLGEDDTARLVGVITADAETAGTAELSYWLAEAYTGQGIVTRAMQSLVAALFSNASLHTLLLSIHRDNEASLAVAVRLGFERSSSGPDRLVYAKQGSGPRRS